MFIATAEGSMKQAKDTEAGRAFLHDIENVCRAHGLSLSFDHEDGTDGSFAVETLSKFNLERVRDAIWDVAPVRVSLLNLMRKE
jgi:hypothetical protein